MKTSRRTHTILLTLLFACGSAAQTHTTPKPAATNQPAAPRTAKPSAKLARDAKTRADAERAQRERRAAVSILLEVERDAASLEEPYERTSVFTACADALWDADEREARVVFRRAWESAVEADEADFKYEQEQGRDGDAPELFTSARESVLAAAAKRDTRAVETWLRALDEWLGRHESFARETRAAAHEANPLDEFTRDARRLALASSLLAGGEYGASARVATPAAAGRVSGPLVEFLLGLRARAPEEADRLYLSLLASARASADANANDVLLLSSYALTPRVLAVVDDDGSILFRALGPQDSQANDAARAAFFDAAAAILLRPAQPSGAAGDSALYFAVGRLLPFFEREAPRHAPALRARLSSLAPSLEATRRASLDAGMERRSLTSQNSTDPLGSLLEDLGRADAAGQGDLVRAKAVEAAARRRLWERAKRLAAEIKDADERDAARFLIAVRQVASLSEAFAEGDGDDFESAAAFARQADLSPSLAPAFRAYGLAQAAELAARRGRNDRAALLFDEAVAYAQQAKEGTELHAAASMMVATFAALLAPARRWETLAAAVASLNADEAFSGNAVSFQPDGVKYYPNERETAVEIFAPFTVERLFGEAGAADRARAAAEARNIEDVLTRDYALVAVARATLRKGSARAELLRRGGK
ncbi:MAG TPA: hypothetical protein VGP08_00435 [Pyrinomonadaceae bacterium]|nr:hypothetical protein [Pyrinomonadaceae bacterium]